MTNWYSLEKVGPPMQISYDRSVGLLLLHCEKSGLVGAYAALRQTAKAKATYQTAQQMLEDLIRSERSNAAMKEGLAAVEHELGKL